MKNYDYSCPGAYFVTICTKNRQCVFGEVKDEVVELSAIGRIAHSVWVDIEDKFKDVSLDEFVVMPNHLHGIIVIHDRPNVDNHGGGLIHQTPTNETRPNQPYANENNRQWILMKNPNLTLGKIIRSFKAKSSKLIHESGFHNFAWQRNYYERIVRNGNELNRIRRYIADNPLNWDLDNNNPAN